MNSKPVVLEAAVVASVVGSNVNEALYGHTWSRWKRKKLLVVRCPSPEFLNT